MSFQVFRVLDQDELSRINAILSRQTFVDGKLTSSGPARAVKNNLQTERTGPEPTQADQIVLASLNRSQVLQTFAFARRIMMPLFNRYENGMEYGAHVDSAIMGQGGEQIRTDFSMTIFLTDPADYDGGELALETSFGEQEVKLDAGEAVVYPSTTIHRVTPVTRGVRLAAVTWIQSGVRDERLRTILFDLNQAASHAAAKGDHDLSVTLSKSYNNLLRYAIEL
jgi:PKHD-type hydroxylase